MKKTAESISLKKGNESSSFLFIHYDIIALCINIYVTWLSIYISELTIARLPENSDFYENLLFLFISIILLVIEINKILFKKKYGKLHKIIDNYMDFKGFINIIIPFFFTEDRNILSLLFAILITLHMDKANKQTKGLKTVIQMITISSVFYNYLPIETSEIANHCQMVLLLMFILYHTWYLLASLFPCLRDKNLLKGKLLLNKVYDNIEKINIRIKFHFIFRQRKLFVLYKRLKILV